MKTGRIKNKKCYKCESNFNCGEQNCWCGKLPNIMPLKISEDCFCENCLSEKIQTKKENIVS